MDKSFFIAKFKKIPAKDWKGTRAHCGMKKYFGPFSPEYMALIKAAYGCTHKHELPETRKEILELLENATNEKERKK